MLKQQLKVIVIGGSLGGLTAALFLREIGWAVTVYERSPVLLGGLGAGIVLNPATVRYFTRHDPDQIQKMSLVTPWLRYLDAEGQVVAEQSASYRFTSYNAIYRGLLAAFGPTHYYTGTMVTNFEQDDEGVMVQLATGQTDQCDLLVCADGVNSTARNILLSNTTPHYAGYIAWRGILKEEEVSEKYLAAIHEAIVYHILPQGHVLTYPIPVIDPLTGQRQTFINWLWYKNIPAGSEFERVMTDVAGKIQEISLKPGAVCAENITRLHQEAADRLPELLSQLILQTEQPFIQAVLDYEVPQMAFGRVCLIGDAAFVARPHAAAGTAKAAEDGWQLSRALSTARGDVVMALPPWAQKQLATGRGVVERSRQAGYRLQHGLWPVGTPLPFGLYEVGDSVMI